MIVKMDLTNYQLSKLGAFLESAQNVIGPPEGQIFVWADGLQKGLFHPDPNGKDGGSKLVIMKGSAAKENSDKQTVTLVINEYEYVAPFECRNECVGSGQPRQPDIYFIPVERMTAFFQSIGRYPAKAESVKRVAGLRVV